MEKSQNYQGVNLYVDDISSGDMILLSASSVTIKNPTFAYVLTISSTNVPNTKHIKRVATIISDGKISNVIFWSRTFGDPTHARTYMYFGGASTGLLICGHYRLPERIQTRR